MELRHVTQPAIPLLVLQGVFIVLFAVFTKYAPGANAVYHPPSPTVHYNTTDNNDVDHLPLGPDLHVHVRLDGGHQPMYGLFQDTHVMVFVGIGFLMTYLKKYGLASVSLNFLIGALTVQWAILVNGFFHLHDGYIEIGLTNLLGADFMAATVLITFGVLLGKVTPMQMMIVTLLEIPIIVINEIIGRKFFGAVDMGDSMFVHIFAAYFGLATSLMLSRKDASTEKQTTTRVSDLFSMIGTVFLWVYWPSFNGSAATGDDQHRAIINTYLALMACCVTSFAMSSLLDPRRRFQMEHIQNSPLAGGVAIGTAANMMTQPFGALLVGTIAGVVSVVGYHHLTPLIAKKLRIHDTCGVHNLHGMPGIIAAVAGAIYAALATEKVYGVSLYEIFPQRAPVSGSMELAHLQRALPSLVAGEGRTALSQALYQLVAMAITIAISIGGGLITGAILRLRFLNKLETDDLYDDEGIIMTEESEETSHTLAPDPSGVRLRMVEKKLKE